LFDYQRLQRMAEAIQRPVEEVTFQTIRGNLPPSVDDLPPELRDELAAVQNLDDKALWAIVKESLPPDQWRRHEYLLRKNQEGTLTAAEQEELARLRAATDRFVFRRSYALALLKWGGTPSLSLRPGRPMSPRRRIPAAVRRRVAEQAGHNDWLVRARHLWILAGVHPPLE